MERKLFSEEIFSKNIPEDIKSLVDLIYTPIPSDIFDTLFDSASFSDINTPDSVPAAEEFPDQSELVEDVRNKFNIKPAKTRKPHRTDGK